MYQALYRKYRSRTFSEIYGQPHITQTLKAQLADKRQSHAYLFTGSRGTGKTSSAKIFAKAVNCLNSTDGEPCNECEICHGIDNGTIFDVVEIDAASNNGVDDIRNLRDEVGHTPSVAKYRVYIIDEVHMLTTAAFNALLKTLEEPPQHAIFILATTEVWKIPATILSRCQRFDFNRISAEIIADRVKYICEKENITIEDNAAVLIAKLADGGMRDALSMLDMCAGSTSKITEASVAESVGLVGRDYLFELVSLINEKKTGEILEKINELYSSSCDMERLCTELIGHYRDLLIARTSKGFRSIITATNEELSRIEKQSGEIVFESLLYTIDLLSDCLDNMKRGASKRTAVETAFIKLCSPELDSSMSALLARIGNIETRLNDGDFTAPASQTPATALSAESENDLVDNAINHQELDEADVITAEIPPENEQLSDELAASIDFVMTGYEAPQTKEQQPPKLEETDADTNEQLFDRWAEVLERLAAEAPMIRGFMDNSRAFITDNYLLIDAPNSQFADMINGDTAHKAAIKNAVLHVTGKKYALGPYKRRQEASEEQADPLDFFLKENSGLIETE